MTDIPGPKARADDEDRVIDCEFALEPAFQALIAAAEKANWPADDIAIALANLSFANIKMRIANVATERAIVSAKLQRLSRKKPFDG